MTPGERSSHGEPKGHAVRSAIRLRSGAALTLVVEVSDGWVVESVARLLPGSTVEVVLAAGNGGEAKRAVITRSEVVALDRRHGIRYRARLWMCPATESTGGDAGPAHGNELPSHEGNLVHASVQLPGIPAHDRHLNWHASWKGVARKRHGQD
jgi:hypothetical protein